ncbi:MAG: tagaturonate epimerase family protein [Planctomycetota bacterium]
MPPRQRSLRMVAALRASLGRSWKLYDASVAYRESTVLVLGRDGKVRTLFLLGTGPRWARITRLFRGTPGGEMAVGRKPVTVLAAPATRENAAALRLALGNLRPRPLGLTPAFGMGDRVGLATPGHAAVAGATAVLPLFAQQSAREMSRTGRSPEDVLDDTVWGAFQAGYPGLFGADADHLKTEEDLVRCANAGFTMFTIDPGDHVANDADTVPPGELRRRFDFLEDAEVLKGFYLGRTFDIGQARLAISFSEEGLARSAVKYTGAIQHAERMYDRLQELRPGSFDFEVSVDETETPTSLADHVFIASELARREVAFTGLAPRLVGDFEKAADYRGDLRILRRELIGHAAIARALGPYKLSIHSGSDKFSIYPLLGDVAGDLLHVKTAGTSWLEALRLVARRNASLYRRIHALALERFQTDRASYHLSTDLSVLPPLDVLADGELESFLDERNGRQLLHVTYGSVLNPHDASGGSLREEVFDTLLRHEAEHHELVASHIEKHIRLLGMGNTRL